MDDVNLTGVTSTNWKNVKKKEIAPGVYEGSLWNGKDGKRALVFEFAPGAKFPKLDTHLSGPEQIFVISGVFNDGKKDHDEGSFINNYALTLSNTKAKYIKVTAENYGICPDWHLGAGGKTWLFVDELIIK